MITEKCLGDIKVLNPDRKSSDKQARKTSDKQIQTLAVKSNIDWVVAGSYAGGSLWVQNPLSVSSSCSVYGISTRG